MGPPSPALNRPSVLAFRFAPPPIPLPRTYSRGAAHRPAVRVASTSVRRRAPAPARGDPASRPAPPPTARPSPVGHQVLRIRYSRALCSYGGTREPVQESQTEQQRAELGEWGRGGCGWFRSRCLPSASFASSLERQGMGAGGRGASQLGWWVVPGGVARRGSGAGLSCGRPTLNGKNAPFPSFSAQMRPRVKVFAERAGSC